MQSDLTGTKLPVLEASSLDADQVPPLNREIDLTGDGKVIKIIVQNGELNEQLPKTGQNVQVHYVGTIAKTGKQFDTSYDRDAPLDFRLNTGQVIKGWDVGVASMRLKEKAVLKIASDYAYGEQGAGPDIPPNAALEFQVELVHIGEATPARWEMDQTERIKRADEQRILGNEYYQKENFIMAIKCYQEGCELLEETEDWEEEPLEQANQVRLSCLLNMSNVYYKTGNFFESEKQANEACIIDPNSVKAKYRLALANAALDRLVEAKTTITEALKLAPANSELLAARDKVHKMLKERNAREAVLYKRMFEPRTNPAAAN